MTWIADRSVWLMALAGCSVAALGACGSDGNAGSEGMAGGAGAAVAGASSGAAGSAAAGAPGAGTPGAGGAPTGGGGAAAGSGGAPTGSGGATAGSGGAAVGMAGAAGSTMGGAPNQPYGVVSCQPAFETICKPTIDFTNGDPTGKGKIFTEAVPDVSGTMKDLTCTACSMLYRQASEIPAGKHPTTVKLILDTHGGVAQTGGAQIQFDMNYIADFANGKSAAAIKQEMLGVLQHEIVHIYQNYGNNGTGEGMADLVRTRTGYYDRNRWVKGGSWKTPYTSSGFFYSWLSGPCTFHSEHYSKYDLELPYKLNKVLGNTSGDASFTAVNKLLMDTFGKDADTLWTEYQNTAF